MSQLPGTYRLIEYGYKSKKGEPFKSISDWYAGSIHYSETGYMNVIVRFAEKPEDMTDLVAYSGLYKIEGSEIIHQVQDSVRPEYIGQFLNRSFKIQDDVLYTEFENTKEFIKFARWQRIQ